MQVLPGTCHLQPACSLLKRMVQNTFATGTACMLSAPPYLGLSLDNAPVRKLPHCADVLCGHHAHSLPHVKHLQHPAGSSSRQHIMCMLHIHTVCAN